MISADSGDTVAENVRPLNEAYGAVFAVDPPARFVSRLGVELPTVHMVGVSLRDIMTARNAGCVPHLILSEKEGTLDEAQLAAMLAQVPGTQVHASITAFAEHLVQQDRRAKADARGEKLTPDTSPGDLS